MMKSLALSTLTFALTVAAPALAEPDLKPFQEEAKAAFDEAMADPLKAANAACGTKIVVKSEYEKFKADEWSGRSHYSWCVPLLEELKSMCETRPAYKKVITKAVHTVSCLFSGVKPAQKDDGSNGFTLRNLSLAKGVFTMHMAPDMANVNDNARATLEKALNE